MKQNFEENDEIEIDLRELFYHVLKKWWLILICLVVGLLGAIGVTKLLLTPQYQSDSMLFILNKTTSVTSLADIQVGNALSADFVVIAKSKPVIDAALDKLTDYNLTRKELLEMLTVENQSDTRILKISATSEDAALAAAAANAVSEETADRMAIIMQTDPPTTIEKAEVAGEPVSPSLTKNALIGMLLGAVLAIGYCVITFLMNDKIRSSEDVEKYLGLTTLVAMPMDNELANARFDKPDKSRKKRPNQSSGKKKRPA